jgi:hypothetical protein
MRIPTPLKRGVILYGDTKKSPASPAELIEYAKAYRDEGRHNDALIFYAQADSSSGIEEIIVEAIADGDFFLYRRAKELLHQEPDPTHLAELAKNAKQKGKLTFARDAYDACGKKKEKSEIEKIIEKINKGSETGRE